MAGQGGVVVHLPATDGRGENTCDSGQIRGRITSVSTRIVRELSTALLLGIMSPLPTWLDPECPMFSYYVESCCIIFLVACESSGNVLARHVLRKRLFSRLELVIFLSVFVFFLWTFGYHRFRKTYSQEYHSKEAFFQRNGKEACLLLSKTSRIL